MLVIYKNQRRRRKILLVYVNWFCKKLFLPTCAKAELTVLRFCPQKTVRMYPFQIHSMALSTFASLIGPFGGFFASGFKRAFKIKAGAPAPPPPLSRPLVCWCSLLAAAPSAL